MWPSINMCKEWIEPFTFSDETDELPTLSNKPVKQSVDLSTRPSTE